MYQKRYIAQFKPIVEWTNFRFVISPGNPNPLNAVLQNANGEIGVPGI
jgi:hypothetical protein